MEMTKPTIITAGIDTSKDKLDAAIHGQPGSIVVPNNPAGWAELTTWLTKAGVTRVGIEATGNYQRKVARHLEKAGLRVITLQPLQVKFYAKLRLQRAKNDRIDAVLIAACTGLCDKANKLPSEPRFDALADQLTFIEQTEEEIVRIKTRIEHTDDARLRRTLQADIKRYEKRRERELKRLIDAISGYDDLAKRFELVMSILAIGERTAVSLVVRMPELGKLSREEAAALAGLAPFEHKSGKYEGQMRIGGGRARLRRALYMPALVGATRYNPILKALYERLKQRGKPTKSAIIACARKLLTIANAVVARGTAWEDRSTKTA